MTYLASNKENISNATNIGRWIKHGKQKPGCEQRAKQKRHTSHHTSEYSPPAHNKTSDIVYLTMDRYLAPVRNAIFAPYEWVRQLWRPNNPAPPPAAPTTVLPETVQLPPSTPPRPDAAETRTALQPSPKRKSTVADKDATQHLRKTKRPRKPDPTDEFLAMIEEAIDRDAARRGMEELLRNTEAEIDGCEKNVEELGAFVQFIEGQIKEGMEDLEMALEKYRADVAKYEAEMEMHAKDRELLKRRLTQAGEQMAELLGRVYEGSGVFMLSLEEGGRMRNGTAVPKEFTKFLRAIADCAQPLAAKVKRVKELRKDFLKASKAAKMTIASPQLSRKNKERRKMWEELKSLERECAKQSKHQDQRERDFLRGVARPWLVETGRMYPVRRASEVSSIEEVEPFEPEEGLKYDTAPISKLGEIRPELQLFLHGRRETAKWRDHVQSHKSRYSTRLAHYLYSYPNSSREELDRTLQQELKQLKGRAPKEQEKQLEANLAELEKFYTAVQSEERSKGTLELPLSPEWAGSTFDVTPSQASTLRREIEPKKLASKRRDIRRWSRRVARARPISENPDASPSGRNPVGPKPEPPAFAARPSPTESECKYGAEVSTLSPKSRRKWVTRLNTRRPQWRQMALELARELEIGYLPE
jgi:hypothetical protein